MKSNFPFLKFLLTRSEKEEQLTPYLPDFDKEEIENTVLFCPEARDILSPSHWSLSIHYSWFFEVLAPFPKTLQAHLLSLLSSEQAKALGKMLKLDWIKSKKMSLFASSFYMYFLKREMMQEDILSLELLPSTEINVLLSIPKSELHRLIDFLGVYDLANDYRQIVDKGLLEKIHHALAPELSQFLQFSVKQPVKWLSPKIPLQNWDGSKEQLMHMLHQRGLVRLGFAIFGESEHFQWHLFHKLDIGRYKLIQRALSQKQPSVHPSYFKNQVLDLIKRFQK